MLIRVFLPSSYCILSTVSNEANIDARQHYVSPLLTLHSYQTYQPQQTYFHFWHGHSFSSSYLPHCLGDFLHAPSSIRDIASIFHDRDHTQPLYRCTPTTPQWHHVCQAQTMSMKWNPYWSILDRILMLICIFPLISHLPLGPFLHSNSWMYIFLPNLQHTTEIVLLNWFLFFSLYHFY